MLFRGRGLHPSLAGRGRGLGARVTLGNEPPARNDGGEVPRTVRRLPQSPIYPSGSGKEVGSRSTPTAGDRLRLLMRDGIYRSVGELVRHLSAAEIVAAMGELLDSGHYFDRVGSSLRLRARGDRETRQRLVELLDGIELAISVAKSREVGERRADFDPSTDVGSGNQGKDERGLQIDAGKMLVLSDPPGDLSLPIEGWVSSTRAILARRGAGKTYLAGVMIEEILEKLGSAISDRPMVVVVDPGGVWWGLLATAAGSPSPHEILLLGGSRGHLSIGARDGAAAADVACTLRPMTIILDLSGMAPVEQHELVADFCDRLWAREHFPIHVVVDEADEFAPQRFGALPHHQRKSLDALSRMFMRGRARGMGGTLISLRPAVLAKNLLSQVEELVLLRLGESNDIRAASTWLENFEHQVTGQQRADCLSHLPVLPTGTAYFLRGGDRPMFRKFRVREKHTYDSSRTLTAGGSGCPRLSNPGADVLGEVEKILATGRKRSDDDAGGEDA